MRKDGQVFFGKARIRWYANQMDLGQVLRWSVTTEAFKE
jgi:hypothetical protein